MNIGICGNICLEALADCCDRLLPGNEILFGKPELFLDELASPSDDFSNLDFCIIAIDWYQFSKEAFQFCYGDNFDSFISYFTHDIAILRESIEKHRSVSNAKIFLFTPYTNTNYPTGFIARLLDKSHYDLFIEYQKHFTALCRSITDVFPVDIDTISNKIGHCNLISPSLFQDFSSQSVFLQAVTEHIIAMIEQFKRYPLKCIVLDLDNTLWGGIVGENGIDELVLDDSLQGMAFKEFQIELVKLHKQGILLAICSKNNTCDALEVFEQHQHMLIRPSMISCFRINWDNKPKNIISIAKELNISLDSIMFVDDNIIEREMVRKTLPEVTILELPQNPLFYAQILKKNSRFWPIQLTDDDIKKTTYFSLDQLRNNARQLSVNIENFLLSCELTIKIRHSDKASISRITQLFNKTNQFNLTTIRYSQHELETLSIKNDNHLFYVEMSDKFGDYGIIASALLTGNIIDSFLLSCRAFGKKVETALLVYLLCFLKDQGYTDVFGNFKLSLKNSMTKDFYQNEDFTIFQSNDKTAIWKFDLSKSLKPMPKWFTLVDK
jgi:FkbH-like protein